VGVGDGKGRCERTFLTHKKSIFSQWRKHARILCVNSCQPLWFGLFDVVKLLSRIWNPDII
jgi:hypothetical protein